MGDPQAPLAVFLSLLDRHGLLGPDGWLAAEVELVSIGDHFDFGGSSERQSAASDGLAIAIWLASHPRDQVTMIAGNHDLARVGELAPFDDATFERVHHQAVAAYRGGEPDPEAEQALCEAYPSLATAEVAARDFSAFSAAQRELVWSLLRARRLPLAHAGRHDLLFCHAGVTREHLSAAGAPDGCDAHAAARALNAALDAAIESHAGGALEIAALHRPGDFARGEGGGMLYHRPGHPDLAENQGHDASSSLGRRFDPRRLPQGLTQVIGHISDAKCRQLLGPWAEGEPAPGALRHLTTDGQRVSYATGLPAATRGEEATLIFIDGLMNRTPVESYAVFEW
ncbi:MAG: transcriptional regulator [Myxococcales bacterium]|nr:transcriptional regulator [Myxococcales bacterium]